MSPMVSLPSRVRRRTSAVGGYVKKHLNFFRIHVLFFTFTPLIFSAILYASNGEFPLSYIDALFNSVSAVTVCGLATVDLSGLTPWQQFLLLFQMSIGNPVIVSWVMVYTRRQFFKRKFINIVEAELSHRVAEKLNASVEVRALPWWKRIFYVFSGRSLTQHSDYGERSGSTTPPRVRPDMIRRMDDALKPVNPSGWISEGQSPNPNQPGPDTNGYPSVSRETDSAIEEMERQGPQPLVITNDGSSTSSSHRRTSTTSSEGSSRSSNVTTPSPDRLPQRTLTLPRTQTVDFAALPRRRPVSTERGDRLSLIHDVPRVKSMERTPTQMNDRRSMARPTTSIPYTTTSRHAPTIRTKHSGFGGFPMPHEILTAVFRRFFPKLERQLTRTVTIPISHTIASMRDGGSRPEGAKLVSYISFEAVVGRNSKFQKLTHDQLEELGGVEYRGLTALLWIVGAYHIFLQLIAFTVIAPYMSLSRWQDAFRTPTLHRNLSPVWFSLFQVVSSYTNTGMSLEDQSMIPFQKAYPTIVFMVILILAGNTAFPIFLRFMIWVLTKIVPKDSRTNETLHFLLDHPRRCFVYLFPSHQTWFLLIVVVALNVTDWFFFLVLDIGTQAIEAIPVGVRVLLGLLQATAVRAAGFGSVPLSALAPAVKVLYVIMMYVSVYPIAMSVRSTNVYEEKSLGIFPETESLDEDRFSLGGTRATVLGRYLGMHMRKQLSFDMWWLGLALFLVCIIERDGLDNAANSTWFSIFTILFELVSAYGTVGLSLGVPYANYSFSGSLRPLSKLIVCVVMLRGRHRGLPVAIDRAIMVPVHSETSPDGISEEPTMLPDEAFINGEILQNGDYIREKSPPPAQERGLIHRRRGSVMSAMSDGQRICEGPRRTNTIITIEEPEP